MGPARGCTLGCKGLVGICKLAFSFPMKHSKDAFVAWLVMMLLYNDRILNVVHWLKKKLQNWTAMNIINMMTNTALG